MKQDTNAKQSKHSFNIIGAAGEYYVAAELSRRGIIATITLKNTPNIDIVATSHDGKRSINIQVKTKQNQQGWILTNKMEVKSGRRNFFVVLVDLYGQEGPDYFIIPKDRLATLFSREHKKWLATPGRNGRPHVDNPIRAFDKKQMKQFEFYHNNWNVLKLW